MRSDLGRLAAEILQVGSSVGATLLRDAARRLLGGDAAAVI
jgi:hypothetical protein